MTQGSPWGPAQWEARAATPWPKVLPGVLPSERGGGVWNIIRGGGGGIGVYGMASVRRWGGGHMTRGHLTGGSMALVEGEQDIRELASYGTSLEGPVLLVGQVS